MVDYMYYMPLETGGLVALPLVGVRCPRALYTKIMQSKGLCCGVPFRSFMRVQLIMFLIVVFWIAGLFTIEYSRLIMTGVEKMFDRTPNARELASMMFKGNHMYLCAEEIAKAFREKGGYACTAEQIEELIYAYNQQIFCFDLLNVSGLNYYAPLFYRRWYPESKSISLKTMSWENRQRREGEKNIIDNVDVFFFDWLMNGMGGQGPAIAFQTLYYILNESSYLNYPTSLISKVTIWAVTSATMVECALEETVAECWLVRQERELLKNPMTIDLEQDRPDFMSWPVFFSRIRTIVGSEMTLSEGYYYLWDNSLETQDIFEDIDTAADKLRRRKGGLASKKE